MIMILTHTHTYIYTLSKIENNMQLSYFWHHLLHDLVSYPGHGGGVGKSYIQEVTIITQWLVNGY